MRQLRNFRKQSRDIVLRTLNKPVAPVTTSGTASRTSSYLAIINLPSVQSHQLQDPTTGIIYWMMDYDALP